MEQLLLVDGSSYLYRAYYATLRASRPMTSPQNEPTGAVFAMLNMLQKLKQDVQFDYAAVVFDAKGKNFRHELYPEYKANRKAMPDDLRPQKDWVVELAGLYGWKVIAVDGVEADDVIATLAVNAKQQDMSVVISSGDKDLMQLVDEHITVMDTMNNAVYDADGVRAKFGVYPNQIVDYLTLVGDKSDNVPGVEKCGEKTAIKWLQEFGNLDNLLCNADKIAGKIGENLRGAISHIPLSKQLVTLKQDVDLSLVLPNGVDDLRQADVDFKKLSPRLAYFGFKSLLKDIPADLFSDDDLFRQPETFRLPEKTETMTKTNYATITNQDELNRLVVRLKSASKIGLDTETTSLDTMSAKLVGISIAFDIGDAVYIPISHSMTSTVEQLDENVVLSTLKPFLEDVKLGKIGQNIKYDQHIFANHGILLKGIAGDSMLASYLLESHLGHGLDELALRHLNLNTIKYEDLCGKGAKQISFADVPLAQATEYACQDADFALRLEKLLKQQMDSKTCELYEKIELPVADILFHMERVGVLIDKNELIQQSQELGKNMLALEDTAYKVAGQPFNLNSPKQLQEILFNKLGIPAKGIKKTTTGGYSTNEAVLEKLALDYPLPKIILEHRSMAKLKSTYTDKLPTLTDVNSRIHTNYAQAVAITGRLASNNPNLQNIPIRSGTGRKIRNAFIASSDCVIVSADYSQIELRILAHLSQDKTMIQTFIDGGDIHRKTAAEIFNILPENVSAEQRRYAKTINFGLVYGMGQYGLAQSLGIDNQAAKNFIDNYFARYTAIEKYMKETKEIAHQNGFVKTLFGRKIYLPDIHSSNKFKQAAAERAAINAPMQGTASDLIKKAMICVFDYIVSGSLKSRMIMQVHDELILEVPKTEVEIITNTLPDLMANVADLSVPLIVDIGIGQNWGEAH